MRIIIIDLILSKQEFMEKLQELNRAVENEEEVKDKEGYI